MASEFFREAMNKIFTGKTVKERTKEAEAELGRKAVSSENTANEMSTNDSDPAVGGSYAQDRIAAAAERNAAASERRAADEARELDIATDRIEYAPADNLDTDGDGEPD